MSVVEEKSPRLSTREKSWSLLQAYSRWCSYFPDIALATGAGPATIGAKRLQRLHSLVKFARQHSRFYREKYERLPAQAFSIEQLPPVSKSELMKRFDDWVTDPEVTRRRVDEFVASKGRIGEPFLGRYAVWQSSGTSGEPGTFVHDSDALAVYDALSAVRFGGLAGLAQWQMLLDRSCPGAKLALVAAVGHFAGVATWERLRQTFPWLASRARVFPVTAPIAEMVKALNEFGPTFIASYPTVLRVLAAEQRSGRLALSPAALWSGGEWLSAAARADVERTFACRVIDDYGASEFMNIAFECPHGALHLNADWVWLEPVDENYRPVPPGSSSATVLLTNLASRIQPFIRYDLGDSITMSRQACRCGSAFPVLKVEGRRDETLLLRDKHDRAIPLLPLALASVVEEGGVHRFQIIQTAATDLTVRIARPPSGQKAAVQDKVREMLTAYLADQGLANAHIRFDDIEPEADPVSGKFRNVWIDRAKCKEMAGAMPRVARRRKKTGARDDPRRS
jgi:phenylacetate-CoA ligase